MSSGLAIDSTLNYLPEDRELVKSQLALTLLPQVIAVAENSPAQSAGLQAGDVIVSIDGFEINLSNQGKSHAFDAAGQVLNLIESPRSTSVSLAVQRGSKVLEIILELSRVCSGVTSLEVNKSKKAYADLENVEVTTGFVAFLQSHDELAFALAHEIGHTVFADSTRNGLSRRQKERRADRFAVHAITCAGYDVGLGADLLARLASADWTSIFGSLSHGRTSTRLQEIERMDRNIDCTDPNSFTQQN